MARLNFPKARWQILVCAILVISTVIMIPSMEAVAISPGQFASWSEWSAYVFSHPPRATGCFVANYPSILWVASRCTAAPLVPLNVGDGWGDWVAQAPSGKLIGNSIGLFQSISGLTSETDSSKGANYYSLQVNSQRFTTSTAYTGGKSTTGWEQFVFLNSPGSSSGTVGVQYWLLGYHSTYGSCPSTGPPGGSSWMVSSSDCKANSGLVNTPVEAASNIVKLSLGGYANWGNSGNDQVLFCISGGSCYSASLTEHVLDLYQHWQDAEFNVFGFCCSSQAISIPGHQ